MSWFPGESWRHEQNPQMENDNWIVYNPARDEGYGENQYSLFPSSVSTTLIWAKCYHQHSTFTSFEVQLRLMGITPAQQRKVFTWRWRCTEVPSMVSFRWIKCDRVPSAASRPIAAEIFHKKQRDMLGSRRLMKVHEKVQRSERTASHYRLFQCASFM